MPAGHNSNVLQICHLQIWTYLSQEKCAVSLSANVLNVGCFSDYADCDIDVCDRDERRGAGGRLVFHDRARAGPRVRRRGGHAVLHRHHVSCGYVYRRSCWDCSGEFLIVWRYCYVEYFGESNLDPVSKEAFDLSFRGRLNDVKT